MDLNVTTLHARDTTIAQALCELIAKAFDANAAARIAAAPQFTVVGSTVKVRDAGAGIQRTSFAVRRAPGGARRPLRHNRARLASLA